MNLQEKEKNKFLGTLLWDAVDVVTFGAFEKKHKKNTTTGTN
jgi:hypothetical protein